MKARRYLKDSVVLTMESDGRYFERTFTIKKVINEGADGICYEAYHEKSGKGVLKEYYPLGLVGLERNSRGQLGHTSEFWKSYDTFRKAKEAFTEPYKMLLKVKQESEDDDIASFIPSFELYYGTPDIKGFEYESTIYIWTPEPKLKTFTGLCEDIHEHPTDTPERDLVTVLNAVKTLAECICALHKADIIHRDIKPANFGFRKRGGELLTQTLQMFDIDSLCSVLADRDDVVGTKGFMEPEARYTRFSNQTDIYSIGATLFYAIIITDETKKEGFIYKDEYYVDLKDMVDSSELITASEVNSNPRLRSILTTILRKCLCKRAKRYQNCEELIEDLSDALFYAVSPEGTNDDRKDEDQILAEAEKSLDANPGKSSSRAILYSLFERPLYSCMTADEKKLNILIIGFRNYGQKFLDACLQVGQMDGVEINSVVISDDATDKEIYLSDRPELDKFFSIDGVSLSEETYGSIIFKCTKATADFSLGIDSISHDTLRELLSDGNYHYIFISLGNVELNKNTAFVCNRIIEGCDRKCLIGYASDSKEGKDQNKSNVFSIAVGRGIKSLRENKVIQRLSYNYRLTLEDSPDIDYRVIKSEFRDQELHDSYVAKATTLKYVLKSIGIDLDNISYEDAAEVFNAMMNEDIEHHDQIRNKLIWLFHRVWVTEKLCHGWQCITDLERCRDGLIADDKHKEHICIVRSRPDRKLRDLYMKYGENSICESIQTSEIEELDELDKVSLMLNFMNEKDANRIRRTYKKRDELLSRIKKDIECSERLMQIFDRWHETVLDIWNSNMHAIGKYEKLRAELVQTVDFPDIDRQKAFVGKVNDFDEYFQPLINSIKFIDWKHKGDEAINNVAFILTYSKGSTLLIPYEHSTSKTEIYDNIATAALSDPKRIVYLVKLEKQNDLYRFMTMFSECTSFMEKKRMKSVVDIYVYGKSDLLDSYIEEELRRIDDRRIRKVEIISAA